ncbi:hypothetical protein IT882_13005 [Microbacterium schleiferi]|uniref:Uncharacterized protein n=1 Tax=Microbacterium schleiferi TaxID=69362 RepID=A0A7S8RGH8_9MICO|nr:hypothetical protein [Microbacterium schleiferi]QPE04111.1 hypothetical protein IT882_13005 [Microbacterium schleiferi]
MTTSRSDIPTGRPLGWKASDEAFAVWLADLQGNPRRRARVQREVLIVPAWAAATRRYMDRTKKYRQLIRELPKNEEGKA